MFTVGDIVVKFKCPGKLLPVHQWHICFNNISCDGPSLEALFVSRHYYAVVFSFGNNISEIGIGISNVQRCLDGVEDCYSKTVEVLSEEINSSKNDDCGQLN